MSHDLQDWVANMPVTSDPEDQQLKQLLSGLVDKICYFKDKVIEENMDMASQEARLDNELKDNAQRNEYIENLEGTIEYYKGEVDSLSQQLEDQKHNEKALEELQKVNASLRKVKEAAIDSVIDLKLNVEKLLNVIWDLYSKYNVLVDDITDKCKVDKPTADALNEINETTQWQNEQIVTQVAQTCNNWNKETSDHAASMALIFNQEKHRIAMRKKFAHANKQRKHFF